MDVALHLILIAACLILSALFSGSETALLRLRINELEQDIEQEPHASTFAARDLLASTSQLLVTILLGNNVVNILGASLAAALAVSLLGEGVGIAVSTLVMTGLVLVFCEVLPKAIAARSPRRISYMVALPLYLFHKAVRPAHLLFDRFVDPLVQRIAGGAEVDASQSAEDVLREARRARGDHPEGSPLAIMGSAAHAAGMTVAEIMMPRTEMVAFPIDTPVNDLLDHMLEERFTRVPVYGESIDHVLGMAHLKDLVSLTRSGDGDLKGILKPVLRIPTRKPILPLFSEMQQNSIHMAIVKDEFGVTQGLVTQEDILEEIVGEIRDEFDQEELTDILPVDEGTWEAYGRVTVLDFNRHTGFEVPAEPGDTLSGLIFHSLGQAARRNAKVRVGDYDIKVIDVSGARITRVHVSQAPKHETEENAS